MLLSEFKKQLEYAERELFYQNKVLGKAPEDPEITGYITLGDCEAKVGCDINTFRDLGSQKLTKQQAIIITGYTGILACDFSSLHKDLEKRFNRPVFIHELPQLNYSEKYTEDFLKICNID